MSWQRVMKKGWIGGLWGWDGGRKEGTRKKRFLCVELECWFLCVRCAGRR